jgi:hypothetical protein
LLPARDELHRRRRVLRQWRQLRIDFGSGVLRERRRGVQRRQRVL